MAGVYTISILSLGALGSALLGLRAMHFISYGYLPWQLLRLLDDAMNEANATFIDSVDEGLMFNREEVEQAQLDLIEIRLSVETLRAQMYMAKIRRQKYPSSITKLFLKVHRVTGDILSTRARVLRFSDRTRRRVELLPRAMLHEYTTFPSKAYLLGMRLRRLVLYDLPKIFMRPAS